VTCAAAARVGAPVPLAEPALGGSVATVVAPLCSGLGGTIGWLVARTTR
jgi:hypothetical protein